MSCNFIKTLCSIEAYTKAPGLAVGKEGVERAERDTREGLEKVIHVATEAVKDIGRQKGLLGLPHQERTLSAVKEQLNERAKRLDAELQGIKDRSGFSGEVDSKLQDAVKELNQVINAKLKS